MAKDEKFRKALGYLDREPKFDLFCPPPYLVLAIFSCCTSSISIITLSDRVTRASSFSWSLDLIMCSLFSFFSRSPLKVISSASIGVFSQGLVIEKPIEIDKLVKQIKTESEQDF